MWVNSTRRDIQTLDVHDQTDPEVGRDVAPAFEPHKHFGSSLQLPCKAARGPPPIRKPTVDGRDVEFGHKYFGIERGVEFQRDLVVN